MTAAPSPSRDGASAEAAANAAARARAIEEASLAAWPALSETDFDGWRLRFANGYTKRSNSITPLGPSRLDLDQKIAACERIYEARGLPAIFRLGPFAADNLDDRLGARRYAAREPVEVRALRLDGPTRSNVVEAPAPAVPARVRALGLDAWLDVFTTLSGAADTNRAAHRQILAAVPGTRRLLVLFADGQPVSCGMGVLHQGRLGLFDLVTDPQRRGRGFGGELLRRTLAWGARVGAAEAYLQVLETNRVAGRLYSRAGFETLYRYHYRQR